MSSARASRERLVAPGVPVDRVVRVLAQVGRGLVREAVASRRTAEGGPWGLQREVRGHRGHRRAGKLLRVSVAPGRPGRFEGRAESVLANGAGCALSRAWPVPPPPASSAVKLCLVLLAVSAGCGWRSRWARTSTSTRRTTGSGPGTSLGLLRPPAPGGLAHRRARASGPRPCCAARARWPRCGGSRGTCMAAARRPGARRRCGAWCPWACSPACGPRRTRPLLLFWTLALWALWRERWVLAGLACGLALLSKYPARAARAWPSSPRPCARGGCPRERG